MTAMPGYSGRNGTTGARRAGKRGGRGAIWLALALLAVSAVFAAAEARQQPGPPDSSMLAHDAGLLWDWTEGVLAGGPDAFHRPAALGEPLGPTFEGPQAGSVLREVGALYELAGLVHRRDGDGRFVEIDPDQHLHAHAPPFRSDLCYWRA